MKNCLVQDVTSAKVGKAWIRGRSLEMERVVSANLTAFTYRKLKCKWRIKDCLRKCTVRANKRYLKWKKVKWAFLMVQWWRICLPMQGTWVWSLGREGPTWCRTTNPMSHSYRVCGLEPMEHPLLKPRYFGACAPNKRSHCNKKPLHHN